MIWDAHAENEASGGSMNLRATSLGLPGRITVERVRRAAGSRYGGDHGNEPLRGSSSINVVV